MRRIGLLGAVVTALFLAGERPARAWGHEGHELVGRIAALNLHSVPRQRVADLLRNDPEIHLPAKPTVEQLSDAMAKAATWPDRINKHATGTGDWHFVDLALFDGKDALQTRCADADCITAKIEEIKSNLHGTGKLGDWEPWQELKFLIHFLGDVHQPLHTATNEDAGGNCLKTHGTGSDELHAVWDNDLVRIVESSPSHRAGSSPAVT